MTYVAHEQRGYYCRDTRVEVTRRLYYMPYAQAGWRSREDGVQTMYSYSSRVFEVYVSCYGIEYISVRQADATINYSRTTSRQVTAAMQELGLNGDEIKTLKHYFASGGKIAVASADGEQWLNGETGEVIA